MTKTATNLLGIVITILSGTYFFVMYCSHCGLAEQISDKAVEGQVMPSQEVAHHQKPPIQNLEFGQESSDEEKENTPQKGVLAN